MSTGYACPVCETPQQDAEHLANHMAITAMVRDEAHAEWLDEHVDDWRDGSPADLAGELVDHAESVDYDTAAFEHADLPASEREIAEQGGEAGHGHGHSHGHQHDHDHSHQHETHQHSSAGIDTDDLPGASDVDSDEVAAIIEEARELTRQQFEDAAVEDDEE